MKTCRICGMRKELDEFSKTKRLEFYPDGRIHWCRECFAMYKKFRRTIKNVSLNAIKVVNGEIVVTFD